MPAPVNTDFAEYVALTMLIYRDGGSDALQWWMHCVGTSGTYAERLERGRYVWANWRDAWSTP